MKILGPAFCILLKIKEAMAVVSRALEKCPEISLGTLGARVNWETVPHGSGGMVHVNQKWGATDKALLASHPV